MAAHALGGQIGEGARPLIDRARPLDGDAELVLAEAGGDVGMGGGVHIRVDANRKAGFDAAPRRHGVEQRQLGFGFAVETVNAVAERVLDFRGGLAHARKHDSRRVSAGGQHARQLAARNDVETGSGFGQQRQHPERRIRLYRVANRVRQRAEGLVIGAVIGQDGLAGIDVGGRAHPCRQIGQRHLFAIKIVAGVGEHRYCGQTKAFRGLSCFAEARQVDRRQKPIVCPTSSGVPCFERWPARDRRFREPPSTGRSRSCGCHCCHTLPGRR